MEKINNFLEKVSKNEKYSSIYNKATTLEEVSTLADEMGYQILPKELESYFKKFQEENNIHSSTGIPESNSFINGDWYSGD